MMMMMMMMMKMIIIIIIIIIIIVIAVPLTHNLPRTEVQKVTKYGNLAM